jgi:hypothetical protein
MYYKQLLPMPPRRNQLPTFLFVADVMMSGDPNAPPFMYTNEKWQLNSPLNFDINRHLGNSSASGPSMKSRPILLPPNSNQNIWFVRFR